MLRDFDKGAFLKNLRVEFASLGGRLRGELAACECVLQPHDRIHLNSNGGKDTILDEKERVESDLSETKVNGQGILRYREERDSGK